MASSKVKAAIKGSIANPEAASKVIDAVDAVGKVAASVAAITTPDATDLASAQTLANANKAKINALIAALKAAGLMSA